MGRLGSFALILALGLALYGMGSSIVGERRRRPELVESARTSAYALLAVVAAANAAMLSALLGNDFSVAYVAENSSRATPTFFKVLALWSADEGSLLLWNLVLAGFVAAVAFRYRRERWPAFGWSLAILHAVAAFYLLLVVGPASPFTSMASVPADGRGPLPLLQNHPLMAAHPPLLYLGFIGVLVPFAMSLGALLSGSLEDAWVGRSRRWMLSAWIFLTLGLLLGALWSYGVLGWGGYWAWDPVENVALLPWLLATAFLHSIRLQERRGMLRVWNHSLAIGVFALATFGTFLTRGSILASVHTFAESLVGPMYLAFLVLVLAVGYGALAGRLWRLRTPGRLDAALSREAVFLGNNLALVALTLVVLVGTVFPLVFEAVTARRVTVGEPYFAQGTAPLFLLLLFLMAVGPLLPWRRAATGAAADSLAVPAALGAAVVVALVVSGMREPAALLAFGVAAFAATATLKSMARLVRSRGGPGAALRANPRLAGGLVAHLGVIVAAVAVTASSAFATHREVTLAEGEAVSFAGTRLTYERTERRAEPHRQVVIAHLAVREDGRVAGRLHPSLNLYPGASEPIGTPSLRLGLSADLYATVLGFEDDGQRATFRLFHTPGVLWLWVGGSIAALGGVAAVWPRRRPERASPSRARALERVGAGR